LVVGMGFKINVGNMIGVGMSRRPCKKMHSKIG
jgi:hypothetical protein